MVPNTGNLSSYYNYYVDIGTSTVTARMWRSIVKDGNGKLSDKTRRRDNC